MNSFDLDSIYQFRVGIDKMSFNENRMNWVQELLKLCDDHREEINNAFEQSAKIFQENLDLKKKISNLKM